MIKQESDETPNKSVNPDINSADASFVPVTLDIIWLFAAREVARLIILFESFIFRIV